MKHAELVDFVQTLDPVNDGSDWSELMTVAGVNSTLTYHYNQKEGIMDVVQVNDDGKSIATRMSSEGIGLLISLLQRVHQKAEK